MTREDATAPLKSGEGRFTGTAGAFFRGSVRRYATSLCIDFFEEKGFLESAFIFKGPAEKIIRLRNQFKEWGE